MRTSVVVSIGAAMLLLGGLALGQAAESAAPTTASREIIELPPPKTNGNASLEEVLAQRRSVRTFDPQKSLSMEQLGQLMWAAQGVTEPKRGLRTAPSAGATYPLELYAVTPEGHYHYVPSGHRFERLGTRDLRRALANVPRNNQSLFSSATLVVVIAADYRRSIAKFGERAAGRYVLFEAGHVAQNLLLEATAQGLACVPTGPIYEDDAVNRLLSIPIEQKPLYTIAIGFSK